MRVLCVLRMFSGLETSVASARWEPTGVPAISKIVEALARSPNRLELMLAVKDGAGPEWAVSDRRVVVHGLGAPVTVLAGSDRLSRWLGFLRPYLSELRQLRRILRAAMASRAELIYVDHANVLAAGVLARLWRGRVVFRAMGVYPAMRAALSGGRLAHRMLRWCYRAPFGAVVCTQDGSGGEAWMRRALAAEVPRVLLLNGVDLDSAAPEAGQFPALPEDKDVVLFVGRLAWHKGAAEFVDGFLSAWRRAPEDLHALVIGAGPLGSRLKARVAKAGANAAFTFVERLPHRHIIWAQSQAQIYVSLNRYGNLSNANLEAMRCGKAVIMPAAQPETGVDMATEALVPADAALRIDRVGDAEALGEAILALHRDGPRRAEMESAMAHAAAAFIPDWSTRIRTELRLLQAISARDEAAIRQATQRGAGHVGADAL